MFVHCLVTRVQTDLSHSLQIVHLDSYIWRAFMVSGMGITKYQIIQNNPQTLRIVRETAILQLIGEEMKLKHMYNNNKSDDHRSLTLVLLNKLRCHSHFLFSSNQIT